MISKIEYQILNMKYLNIRRILSSWYQYLSLKISISRIPPKIWYCMIFLSKLGTLIIIYLDAFVENVVNGSPSTDLLRFQWKTKRLGFDMTSQINSTLSIMATPTIWGSSNPQIGESKMKNNKNHFRIYIRWHPSWNTYQLNIYFWARLFELNLMSANIGWNALPCTFLSDILTPAAWCIYKILLR